MLTFSRLVNLAQSAENYPIVIESEKLPSKVQFVRFFMQLMFSKHANVFAF